MVGIGVGRCILGLVRDGGKLENHAQPRRPRRDKVSGPAAIEAHARPTPSRAGTGSRRRLPPAVPAIQLQARRRSGPRRPPGLLPADRAAGPRSGHRSNPFSGRGAVPLPAPEPPTRLQKSMTVAPSAASSSVGTRLCRSIHAYTSGEIHPVTSRMRSWSARRGRAKTGSWCAQPVPQRAQLVQRLVSLSARQGRAGGGETRCGAPAARASSRSRPWGRPARCGLRGRAT